MPTREFHIKHFDAKLNRMVVDKVCYSKEDADFLINHYFTNSTIEEVYIDNATGDEVK